ncbi:MAG: DEAD/DEAH box helicase [Legionellales bacterium]
MQQLALTPSGHLHLIPLHTAHNEENIYHTEIIDAFTQSQEQGLLQLLTLKVDAHWSMAMKYWRNYLAQYVNQLCHYASAENYTGERIPAPNLDHLQAWLLKMPPMPGSEYCTPETMTFIWSAFDDWCRVQIVNNPQGVAGFLGEQLPAWQQVGRVCFHLAENKQDTDYPFAFIATYAASMTGSREIQYKQLNKALQEYASNTDKQALYNLLKPIHEAAKQCEWVRELVDSQDIYHPMAWTPEEAYQLLLSVQQLESCGLIVKCPNWWKKRSKPKVQITIGNKNGSHFNADTLLNFDIHIALDGEPLTAEEWNAIVQAKTGLIILRGQYIEVSQEKLQQALSHWQTVQSSFGRDGVSFIEGMRLLAGARDLVGADFAEELHEWSGIQASTDLSGILDKFRHPETINANNPGKALHATLRPYQEIGATWLDFLTELGLGACLADDMGLGKTMQIISLLLMKKKRNTSKPSLLILPASLLANWKSELQQFAPSLRCLFLHSSELSRSDIEGFAEQAENALQDFDLVITTYGMLQRQNWLIENHWHLIILDEAQAIKNPVSEQSKQAKKLKGFARIALTGTPIENRLGDLWSLFDFICPGLLGTSTRFKQFIKSVESAAEVSYAPLRRLVQPYILRRLKTDKSIISDLPDKTEMKAWCTLTKEQLALYTQAVNELAHALKVAEEGIARKGLVLSYLTRFKQICNHPSQVLGDKNYEEQRSGKFLRLAEICEEIATRQEKVLIFTQYREMTLAIASYLEQIFGVAGLVLHGGTPVAKRKLLVDQFQNEQGPPFFVLSLKAGGTGLNLTAASHVIHFDRWWNPAVENQATDRAFRIGQKRNVLVHKFICKGTVEEKIDQMILEKVSLASDLLQANGATLLTEMNDKQLLDLVRLDVCSLD